MRAWPATWLRYSMHRPHHAIISIIVRFPVQLHFSIGFWRCGVSRFRALTWFYVCISGMIHDTSCYHIDSNGWCQWPSEWVMLPWSYILGRTSFHAVPHMLDFTSYILRIMISSIHVSWQTLLSMYITLGWISIISVELRSRAFTNYGSVVLCSYHRLNHAFVSYIIVRSSHQHYMNICSTVMAQPCHTQMSYSYVSIPSSQSLSPWQTFNTPWSRHTCSARGHIH